MKRTGKPFTLTPPLQPETCARYCFGLLMTNREVELLKQVAAKHGCSEESIILSFIQERLAVIEKE